MCEVGRGDSLCGGSVALGMVDAFMGEKKLSGWS